MVMQQKWYKSRFFTIFLHVLAWSAFIAIPYLLRQSTESTANMPQAMQERMKFFRPSFEVTLLFNAINIAFFYFNAYVLMPQLLNKKKTWQYIIVTTIAFLAVTYAVYFLRIYLTGSPFRMRFPIFSFFNLLLFYALSLAYRFTLDKNRNERIQQQKETENLKTELLFLRSQVSPHFMFNVLNNIVALSRIQPQLVEPALIQLSQLLRYMLYESNEEKVTLEKEVEYLNNYIQLQQMRFGDDVKIEVNEKQDAGGLFIEPMLLIPFVENAFKHGVGLIENPEIIIDLQQTNGDLVFEVCNKFNKNSHEIKDKHSGIGLQNVIRRLNLLYPGKHELKHFIKDDYYCIHLMLELK
jgi:two-component system, LytTR family, sensor kinase